MFFFFFRFGFLYVCLGVLDGLEGLKFGFGWIFCGCLGDLFRFSMVFRVFYGTFLGLFARVLVLAFGVICLHAFMSLLSLYVRQGTLFRGWKTGARP